MNCRYVALRFTSDNILIWLLILLDLQLVAGCSFETRCLKSVEINDFANATLINVSQQRCLSNTRVLAQALLNP